MAVTPTPAVTGRPVAGSVWADREFRGLWAALAGSLAGDQLARVAVTVLIFQATGSAGWAAAGYAVTLLPALIGGPLLSGIADRRPRRQVMVVCDLACAVLVAGMAVPGVPLPAAAALLFAVTLLGSPFTAARAALSRDVFPDDRYATATAVTNLTSRAALVAGFAAGGVLVALVGPRQALLVDAVTFLVSAVVVRATVRDRPAAQAGGGAGSGGPGGPGGAGRTGSGLVAGMRLVFGDRWLRTLTLFAWLAAFHVAPVGVVTALVAEHGGGPVAVGLLLAAQAAGSGVAMVVLTARVRPERRVRLMVPLSLLASLPLAATAADPGLLVTGLLWGLAGAGTAYQLAANVAFVTAVPNALRGQAFGLVGTGLAAGQGIGILAAGALSEVLGPARTVATLGAAGTAAALALARSTRAGRAATDLTTRTGEPA